LHARSNGQKRLCDNRHAQLYRNLFKRGLWYPNIGFEKREFEKDLRQAGARRCGGVFAGACDRDIPAHIGNTLRAAEKPTFLYWLTLNSHLPVPPGLNLDVDNCERVSPVLARDFPANLPSVHYLSRYRYCFDQGNNR
jgi:phosphoglycerol transferase MdoB-like AlkP superfamily enzyme